MLMLVSQVSLAQDPITSQAFSNPIFLNPAFAGYEGCSRIITTYRLQWPDIGPYHRGDISYDQASKHLWGGVSVSYRSDYGNGGMKTHTFSHAYAPRFRMFNKQLILSPAFEFSVVQKSFDDQILTREEMNEPIYGHQYLDMYQDWDNIPQNTRTYLDWSLGILMSIKGLVVGGSFRHVTQPDHSFSSVSALRVNSTAHISYSIEVTEKVRLTTAIIYQYQNGYDQILPSLSAEIYGARIGVANRFSRNWPNAFIVMAGYQINWFGIGYSYDIGTDSIARGGSHEINLSFKFNCKNKDDWRKGPKSAWF